MAKSNIKAQAVLHVVRAKLIVSLNDRAQTPRELAARLPDVPLGTLYRHLNVLLEAGIVEVVKERRVHGTVERTFALKAGSAYLTDRDREELTPELLTGIVQSLTSVVNDAFSRYAEIASTPYPEGAFSMAAQAVYLDAAEILELRNTIRAALSKVGREPGPERERRLVAFFSVPDVSDPTDLKLGS